MGAVSDIQAWADVYRKLYAQVLDPFFKSDVYPAFNKATEFPHVTAVGSSFKSWKGKSSVMKSKWNIDRLSDADLDKVSAVLSKDFFNKVALESKNSADYARLKSYVERGIECLKIAKGYKDKVNSIYSYNPESYMKPAEVLAIGGMTMIFLATQPYHLFVGFAWHSTNDRKAKTPDTALPEYYEFFTDSQWIPMMKYCDRMVRDNTLPTLLDQISKLGHPTNLTIDQAKDRSDIDAIRNAFGKTASLEGLIRLIGINATKLMVDIYKPN